MFGEVEYAGTFFAHSFVFCEVDGAKAADDSASRRGDVTGLPFDVEAAGFMSGDWTGDGVAGNFEFLYSHLLSQRAFTQGEA